MPTLFDILEAHKQNKDDKRKFGLVLQGGGMRASFGAGATFTLLAYDLADSFDHVVGSSAGAINGTYFIHKYTQANFSYSKDLTNKHFINLRRQDKKVDVDWAIDEILKVKYPIDATSMQKSKSQLHIVVTDAKNGKRVVLSEHHKFKQIYEELRATAALPILYDKEVLIDGHYYVDGSVSDALPVDVAVQLGCTDIVVITNQQVRNYKFGQRHTRLAKHLIKHFAKHQSVAIQRELPTNEHVLHLNIRQLTRPNKKLRVYVLEPSDEKYLISMTTIDKEKVASLAKLGVTDMDAFLNKELLQAKSTRR